MSGRLDHAKIKARTKGAHGEHTPHRLNTDGWRTEWPEEFPVTVTTFIPAESVARATHSTQSTFSTAA